MKKRGGRVTLTVADFFSGAGGFSEGFRQMGVDVVFALDNWKPAVDTHNLNHPTCKAVKMDIFELDTPEKIDAAVPDTAVIIGSPPCVAFSGSNKAGKADKSLGICLIEAYLRIIAWKKSKGTLKYWILENVPNSTPYVKDEYTWEELGLQGNGPSLKVPQKRVFNAADFGAPQGRTRLFCGDYPLPKITHAGKHVHMRKVLECLTDPLSYKDEEVTDPNYPDLNIPATSLTDHLYDTKVQDFEWKNARRLKEDHGFMGKMSFPEDLDRPSRTIMATRSASTREAMVLGAAKGKDGKWESYRMPTIREIASIMSFPITYQFEGKTEETKYRLVGNAVCPKMSAALAKAILAASGLPIPVPDFSHRPRSTTDLTGTKREGEAKGPKSFDSRFHVHIPYLKIKSFRVELDNRDSDFGDGKIRWSCLLYQGNGEDFGVCRPDFQTVESLSKTYLKDFGSFEKDIKTTFNGRLADAKTLQEIYCRLGGFDGLMGPMEILEAVKELVDRHYPEWGYGDKQIDNSGGWIQIKRGYVPLRTLAALYACKWVTRTLGETDDGPRKGLKPSPRPLKSFF